MFSLGKFRGSKISPGKCELPATRAFLRSLSFERLERVHGVIVGACEEAQLTLKLIDAEIEGRLLDSSSALSRSGQRRHGLPQRCPACRALAPTLGDRRVGGYDGPASGADEMVRHVAAEYIIVAQTDPLPELRLRRLSLGGGTGWGCGTEIPLGRFARSSAWKFTVNHRVTLFYRHRAALLSLSTGRLR
jgi:hypothetical protein